MWSHQLAGSWIVDGVRISFDAARNVISLMMGNLCVDQMTLEEYRKAFGSDAVRRLMRGA